MSVFVNVYRWLLPAALLTAGCSHQLIPNTDVEDTAENRAAIQFCETYRKAVELRDVGRLMQMAAPDYYEDGGNVDASDDLDHAGLEEYLKTKFKDTRAIRYEIRYRRVTGAPNDVTDVDFTYTASYKLGTEEGEVWRRTVADSA